MIFRFQSSTRSRVLFLNHFLLWWKISAGELGNKTKKEINTSRSTCTTRLEPEPRCACVQHCIPSRHDLVKCPMLPKKQAHKKYKSNRFIKKHKMKPTFEDKCANSTCKCESCNCGANCKCNDCSGCETAKACGNPKCSCAECSCDPGSCSS